MRLIRLLALLALLSSGLMLEANLAHARVASVEMTVTVLMSQSDGPYQEALAGFQGYISQKFPQLRLIVAELNGNPAEAQQAARQAVTANSKLIFAVGTLAADAALSATDSIPVVAVLVLNASTLGQARNATAVVLEFPLETELRWLKQMLPGQSKIGVLYSPADNQQRIEQAAIIARQQGLNLNPRRVEEPQYLQDNLESFSSGVDVLWGIADPVVMTPQTARAILLFSFRNRVPVTGLSQSWVRAGALYALERDFMDIGVQGGELAAKILQGVEPASLRPLPPRKVLYSINLDTARHMRLTIPDKVLNEASLLIEEGGLR